MQIKMPVNWWLEYLGKPWAANPCPPESYNCGELVRSVYRDFTGIDSPAIPVENANDRYDCIKAMQPELFNLFPLCECEKICSLDVAFMGRKNQLAHCGIAVETVEGIKILHCPQAASGVVLDEPLFLKMAGFPVIRYFRHANLNKAHCIRGAAW